MVFGDIDRKGKGRGAINAGDLSFTKIQRHTILLNLSCYNKVPT